MSVIRYSHRICGVKFLLMKRAPFSSSKNWISKQNGIYQGARPGKLCYFNSIKVELLSLLMELKFVMLPGFPREALKSVNCIKEVNDLNILL